MARKQSGGSAAPSSSQASRVDLREIERVLEFMNAHGLEELEYSSGELHVRLRRQNTGGAVWHSPGPAAAVSQQQSAAPARAAALEPAAAAPGENLHIVKSPIVGTFYSSPSPDAPPFVQVGETVKRGQILCIVEAMKLMNEIEADQAGEVMRLLAENGKPVEYGQPLFALKPLAEA